MSCVVVELLEYVTKWDDVYTCMCMREFCFSGGILIFRRVTDVEMLTARLRLDAHVPHSDAPDHDI